MRSHLHEEGLCKETASAKALQWKEFGIAEDREVSEAAQGWEGMG